MRGQGPNLYQPQQLCWFQWTESDLCQQRIWPTLGTACSVLLSVWGWEDEGVSYPKKYVPKKNNRQLLWDLSGMSGYSLFAPVGKTYFILLWLWLPYNALFPSLLIKNIVRL